MGCSHVYCHSQKIIVRNLVCCAGTSSIDTTCTIWGLETGQVLGRVNVVSGHVKTQLIAHDKEVKEKVIWFVFSVTAFFGKVSPLVFSFPAGLSIE